METAFVAMLLLTIFAGLVDTAWLFTDTYKVAAAARGGARMASANPLSTTFAADAGSQAADSLDGLSSARVTEILIYKADPVSGAMVTAGCGSNCFRVSLGADGEVSGVSGSWTGRRACLNSSTDTVGVQISYRHDSLTGWFFDDRVITQRAAMRLEPVTLSAVCTSS